MQLWYFSFILYTLRKPIVDHSPKCVSPVIHHAKGALAKNTAHYRAVYIHVILLC